MRSSRCMQDFPTMHNPIRLNQRTAIFAKLGLPAHREQPAVCRRPSRLSRPQGMFGGFVPFVVEGFLVSLIDCSVSVTPGRPGEPESGWFGGGVGGAQRSGPSINLTSQREQSLNSTPSAAAPRQAPHTTLPRSQPQQKPSARDYN